MWLMNIHQVWQPPPTSLQPIELPCAKMYDDCWKHQAMNISFVMQVVSFAIYSSKAASLLQSLLIMQNLACTKAYRQAPHHAVLA